jgi:molybdopterin-guanine dinucleotide biosynthesis protein A
MQIKDPGDITITSSAAILVGGKSRRFGSDKVFMKIGNLSVSRNLYDNFSRIFTDVFFVSNEEKKIVKNQTLYIDLFQGKGPLGGLYTALKYAAHSYCFVTACDTPFINGKLVELLWDNIKEADAVIPVWDGKTEPLAAFYHIRCKKIIEELLETKNLSMKNFIEQINAARINLNEVYSSSELQRLFLNINTPGNFEKAQKIFLNSQ